MSFSWGCYPAIGTKVRALKIRISYQFSNGEKVNVGIAFVVPADKIVEQRNYPELRDTEREWIAELQATLVNSADGAERHGKKRFPWRDWRTRARKE